MYGSSIVGLIGVIAIIALGIYIAFTYCFVNLAKEKGCDGTGTIWLMGILGSPFLAGIYVAALPDRGQTGIAAPGAVPQQQDINSQLPPI